MTIVEKKKQNNIAEYIIHMYQTEDLIRVFDCDIDKIRQYVISHIPEEDSSKEEISGWYSNILSQMKDQQILKEGHLSEVQGIVAELEAIKENLLDTDNEFITKYKSAQADIDEMRSLSKGAVKGDVQICLNGIYGLLLAKINGREVPKEFQAALEKFGDVLSYLSYKYNQEGYLSKN